MTMNNKSSNISRFVISGSASWTSSIFLFLIPPLLRKCDYAKFNARGEQLVDMENNIQQFKLRLESYEKTLKDMEERAW